MMPKRTNIFLTLTVLAIAFDAAIGTAQAQQTTQTPATQTPAPLPVPKSVYPVVGVPATTENVVLAAIKQNALDLKSDEAIDDFARIEYCSIYTKYYPNEFDWRRVRVAMRKKIEQDKATYPDTLYLERVEKIGQYDFPAGMLLLSPASVMHTRALLLANLFNKKICGDTPLNILPTQFIALLDKPLIMDGIELTEEEARSVIAGLTTVPETTNQRFAYGRYTITFKGAEPLQVTGPAQLDATLDNVTLYQDPQYTRPFWSGQSSAKSYKQKQGGALDVIPFKGVDTTEQSGLAPKALTATTGPPAATPVAPPPTK